jgi:hypothetical protein
MALERWLRQRTHGAGSSLRDPLNEVAYRKLMRCHERLGERREAVRLYERLTTVSGTSSTPSRSPRRSGSSSGFRAGRRVALQALEPGAPSVSPIGWSQFPPRRSPPAGAHF